MYFSSNFVEDNPKNRYLRKSLKRDIEDNEKSKKINEAIDNEKNSD